MLSTADKKAAQALRSKKHYEANKEKMKARAKRWCAENPEKVSAIGKVYRAGPSRPKTLGNKKICHARNKEKELAQVVLYRETHKEQLALATREWAKRNPEKRRDSDHRGARHRRVRRATPGWANREMIVTMYKEARALSLTTGIKHHVDHVIPLRGKLVSGLHVETNLRVITASENQHKHNRINF